MLDDFFGFKEPNPEFPLQDLFQIYDARPRLRITSIVEVPSIYQPGQVWMVNPRSWRRVTHLMEWKGDTRLVYRMQSAYDYIVEVTYTCTPEQMNKWIEETGATRV